MVKENKIIEVINQSDLKGYKTYQLVNCIIKTFDLVGAFELNVNLSLEKCIIYNFQIHSCWFTNGLTLKNNIIVNSIDYQMGGHNLQPIIIEGNIFNSFLNFFDCHFENVIEVKNNIFERGTNLLGNKGEGFENSFAEGWVIENNVGNIDVNNLEGY